MSQLPAIKLLAFHLDQRRAKTHNKIVPVITMKGIVVRALFVLVGLFPLPSIADEALQHKCFLEAKVAQDIAVDRDKKVPYGSRQKRNDRLSSDMPSMNQFLKEATKVIYFDLKDQSPADIAIFVGAACIQNG